MIPELEQFGFTRNEANVYLAALKLGATTVSKLANATGLNRITVHSIVEKFEAMQLLQSSLEGKRRRISAASPGRLSVILDMREDELLQKKRALSRVLPSLDDAFRMAQRGIQIRSFHGEKGYEQICLDVLTSKTETLEYANIEALMSVIGPYVASDYLPTKYRLQLSTKFLYLDTPGAHQYIQKAYLDPPEASPMEAKFIPSDEFQLDSFFVIYDDKLAILTPSTMDGVIIQDKGMYEALRSFFYFVWGRAGEAVGNR
ncbi:MAG: helix-turn-helix domain-containing protein [Candidatus Peregrinibacteria bacterium]